MQASILTEVQAEAKSICLFLIIRLLCLKYILCPSHALEIYLATIQYVPPEIYYVGICAQYTVQTRPQTKIRP